MDLRIDTLKKELKDLKEDAIVCLKREKEINSVLLTAKNKIQKTEISTFQVEHLLQVISFLEELSYNKFQTKSNSQTGYSNGIKPENAYWLENKYSKTFKKDYDISYYKFNIDTKSLAKKLLNKDLVEKIIYTNIIYKNKECTWRDENPYFSVYEDFYYPSIITVYCDKNFDNSKIYSLEQISELARKKQIVISSRLNIDENNKTNCKKINNLGLCKFDFKLNKIQYKENDNVVIRSFDKNEIHKDNIFNLNYLNSLNEYVQAFERFKDEELLKSNIAKFTVLFPNFLDTFTENLLEDLDKHIEESKTNQLFITEYFKYRVKKS
ncbi:MAG: hypothetical protein KBT30_00665, partial [Clostridiales bacterium]|nr:hypothetical protein [Candidatus Apopatousia equi]